MQFAIRPLRPDEAEPYREIRLEALRLHPEAFGSSFEEEDVRPPSWFAGRLTTSTVFGGFAGGRLLGTAGFLPETGLKRAHKGHLWGVYVSAEARRTGLARSLSEAVIAHARTRAEVLLTSVTRGNETAHRLYLSLGFAPYGIAERSLKIEGRYYDEVMLALSMG